MIRALVALALLVVALIPTRLDAQLITAVPEQTDIAEIATDTYVYAYPLVLMELTRRVMTNAGPGAPPHMTTAPMNQFAHLRSFPDPTVTDVVRPNADTLSSSLWFDVSAEPLVIDVPDSEGRYYLLPTLDMWTDVFASPGKRTSGTGPQTFALTAPGWTGMLPAGIERITAPTPIGWLMARTQTNGKSDFPAVQRFQDGLKAVPLSSWGKDYTPPAGTFDPKLDMRAPVAQLTRLTPAAYFALFAELMKTNPPHANDYPMRQRMARLGIVPGKSFDMTQATPEVRIALQGAPQAGAVKLFEGVKHAGIRVNGWRIVLTPMGTYGTDYLRRQVMAYGGLGANLVEDAIYSTSVADVEGRPLESAKRYTLHFAPDQLPPARAFWSLSMYDDQQRFTANPLGRYAIGDRDVLKKNADGSLDLYVQRASPGADKESNWLPAPREGRFSLTLRLYWPQVAALDGTWSPPPIDPVK